MIKYKEFVRMLEEKGCTVHRKGGKHIIYRHPQINRNLIITKAKVVSPGIYRECCKLLEKV
jgi:predicted RNA binding protein YcfA (HicA-like mRNA interferase family)